MSLELKPNNTLGFGRDDVGVRSVWPGQPDGEQRQLSWTSERQFVHETQAIRAETASAKETRHCEEMRHQACKGAGREVEVEEITLSGVVWWEKGGRFLP